MKRLFLFLSLATLISCTCLPQIPPQYAYVDSNCNAILEDYRGIVIATDNCSDVQILQEPTPGQVIGVTTEVILRAIDGNGNESSVSFEVRLLDTIPPDIQLNPDWAYEWGEVGDMWWTVVKHTQKSFIEGKELVATWDTLRLLHGAFTVMNFTIPIPDSLTHDVYWNYLLTK